MSEALEHGLAVSGSAVPEGDASV